MATPKKPAPKVISPVVKAMTATPLKRPPSLDAKTQPIRKSTADTSTSSTSAGPGASSSGKAKPRTHQGFATEEDAIAGGLHVARPPAGLPDAWGQGGTTPNPNAVKHANPNARFKRGPRQKRPVIKEPARLWHHW